MNYIFHPIIEFLAASPVILLFLVIAGGYFLGEIRFPGGFRLGTVAVYFMGVALGCIDIRFKLSDNLSTLGVALFVYCLGLEAGPGFFRALKSYGIKPNIAIATGTVVSALSCFGLSRLFHLDHTVMAGLFTGALNNTAALGAAVDRAHAAGLHTALMEASYGLAYPFGVVTTLLLLIARSTRGGDSVGKNVTIPRVIRSATIKVTQLKAGIAWTAGQAGHEAGVIITRIRLPGEKIQIVSDSTILSPGALIVVVGRVEQILYARELLGEDSPQALEDDLGGFEIDRYQISNPQIVGRRLGELGIERLGAVITRIRRGDIDLPIKDSTVLLLGDRVRVVCYRSSEQKVREFFGNSLQTLTEMGYATFAIGISLGLLLGQIPIPIPGVGIIHLGSAGGTLLVALILGWQGRTGEMIWNVPFTTNMTLRQFGLIIFLACAGLRAGGGLWNISHAGIGGLIVIAILIPLIGHATTWGVLSYFGEKNIASILGYSCAFQTQPAALAFAAERADRNELNLAYARVYPMSIISKIVLTQVLLNLH